MKYQDGDQLGGGLVFSGKGGYSVAVYRCECGREQTASHPEFSGGLSSKAAINFGWEQQTSGDWLCPFCAGNEDKLEAVFRKAKP